MKPSQGPYGSRVVLGIWREDQLAALQAERFQVDRETAADILGLLHSPMELIVHGLWDSRAGILAGKSSKKTKGAYKNGARYYVLQSGPPKIYEGIYAVRLSRQAIRTFRLRTDAEKYIVARDTSPPTPFDPSTLREETDLIICTDGSYISATSVDPPKAGWGFTVSH